MQVFQDKTCREFAIGKNTFISRHQFANMFGNCFPDNYTRQHEFGNRSSQTLLYHVNAP